MVRGRGLRARPGSPARGRGRHHDLQRAVQRLAQPLGRRPAHDAHRDALRPLPVCRRAVVQHSIRPGRHRHGARVPLGRSRAGPRRAALSRRHAGRLGLAGERRAARQDPARGPRRRDGGHGRGPVRALLRQLDSATPLFVVLAGAFLERTGDVGFARELWPHVERALGWIDAHGDVDGDGFVEYSRRSARGLVQQGWKDSQDPCSTAMVLWPRGRSRSARCRRSCSPPGSRLRASPRPWKSPRARAGSARAREGTQAALRGGFLERGARHLRARARRAEAPLRSPDLERGPMPVRRHRSPERAALRRRACSTTRPSRAGASVRSRRRARTGRCPTTTARSGRTTTR